MQTQLKEYPEFLQYRDLIKLGLFNTARGIYSAKARGDFPKVTTIGRRKPVIKKNDLITWLGGK